MSSRLTSKEDYNSPKKHRLFSLIVGLALVVIAVYVAYTLISNMIQIQADTETYNRLVEQTNSVSEENARIANYLENDENLGEYIAEIAREKLDYANPDERIYYIIPSSGE